MLTWLVSLAAAVGLWILWEIAGEVIGSLLSAVLSPIFRPVVRPVERLAGWLCTGPGVALLWIATPATYLLWAYAMDAASPVLRVAALAAFLATTPVALGATFAWRRERARPRRSYRRRDRFQRGV